MSDGLGSEPDSSPKRTGVPTRARAAGFFWILSAILILAGLVALSRARPPAGEPGWALLFIIPRPLILIFLAVFAVQLLWAGVRTARGSAADTERNGTGSVLFAVVFSYLAWMLWHADTLTGCLLMAAAVGLLAAAVLAMLGRREYLTWKDERRL